MIEKLKIKVRIVKVHAETSSEVLYGVKVLKSISKKMFFIEVARILFLYSHGL